MIDAGRFQWPFVFIALSLLVTIVSAIAVRTSSVTK
jgi:hypothetical protein